MKKVWFLALGMFALGMDAYIVAGLLPDMSKSFNKSSAQIGQGVSIFTFSFALSAPIFSTLLAKFKVKDILILAMIIFGLANLMTMFSPNYTMYIISRGLAGVGAGLFSPMAVSSGAYLVDQKHKGKALAFIVGGMSVGTVIGVPLGLQVTSFFNWRFAIGVIVFISIVSLILIYLLLPNFKLPAPPNLKDRFSLFFKPQVLRVVSVTLCAAVASLGLYTYLSNIINYYLSSEHISIFLTVWGLGGLIGSMGIGVVIDKYKNTRLLMLMILVVLALSIGLIPLLINLPVICFIPFLIWGAMGWATQAPQQHILIQNNPDHRGSVVALNSSINYLGSSIGASVGGLLATTNVLFLIYMMVVVLIIGVTIQAITLRMKA
ncbi:MULTISPECIES: MFS transporter [Staphylococcus]|uniref:MFS transporter n=1 Tax=Staphylococcus hsinchuensis TaxID=3051183 RepID=A0ABZ3EEY8_9STAP|nr:MFS transporter [Staphylococcus sp. Marseille-Q6910]